MTNAELVILSLIAEHARHGYEIEQIIEARGMREWTEIGFSSIYYILKKLEKGGLIESRTEQPAGRGPARKVFRVTQAGEKALQTALFEALSAPPAPLFPPFTRAWQSTWPSAQPGRDRPATIPCYVD